LIDRLKEYSALGKACEVGLYSFQEWYNNEPIVDSVIIDVVMFHGPEDKLIELGEKFFQEGHSGYLINDGEKTFLIVECEMSLSTEIKEYPEIRIERNVKKKFLWPNCINGKTGKRSRIIKKWEK